MKVTVGELRRLIQEVVHAYPPEMVRDDEPDGGEPCPRCGGTNTHHEDPIPSMMGYGEETALTCDDCGETFAEDPLHGGFSA